MAWQQLPDAQVHHQALHTLPILHRRIDPGGKACRNQRSAAGAAHHDPTVLDNPALGRFHLEDLATLHFNGLHSMAVQSLAAFRAIGSQGSIDDLIGLTAHLQRTPCMSRLSSWCPAAGSTLASRRWLVGIMPITGRRVAACPT